MSNIVTRYYDANQLSPEVPRGQDIPYICFEGITFNDFVTIDNTGTLKIPENVNVLGYKSFAGTPLKSIVIPKNIKIIEPCAFYNCVHLERVEFEEDSEILFCDSTAFIGCTKVKEFYVPTEKIDIFKNIRT